MINSILLQNLYQKIYSALREYIWSMDIVELIADFEIACYSAFPDLAKVKSAFSALRREVLDAVKGDDELEAAFYNFNKFIDSANTSYLPLKVVKEVVQQCL